MRLFPNKAVAGKLRILSTEPAVIIPKLKTPNDAARVVKLMAFCPYYLRTRYVLECAISGLEKQATMRGGRGGVTYNLQQANLNAISAGNSEGVFERPASRARKRTYTR